MGSQPPRQLHSTYRQRSWLVCICFWGSLCDETVYFVLQWASVAVLHGRVGFLVIVGGFMVPCVRGECGGTAMIRVVLWWFLCSSTIVAFRVVYCVDGWEVFVSRHNLGVESPMPLLFAYSIMLALLRSLDTTSGSTSAHSNDNQIKSIQ